MIFVPMDLLTAGTNTLHIESGISYPDDAVPYDDFMLTDMTMTVVPEPATIFMLGLGFLMFRRKII